MGREGILMTLSVLTVGGDLVVCLLPKKAAYQKGGRKIRGGEAQVAAEAGAKSVPGENVKRRFTARRRNLKNHARRDSKRH